MKNNEKVIIGWIDAGQVLTGFVAHVMQILIQRHDRVTDVLCASGPYLSLNRNKVVEKFLESDADWLLSFDSDVCIKLEDFDKLIAGADSEKRPIIGGKYYLPWDGQDKVVLAAMVKDPEVDYSQETDEKMFPARWITNFGPDEIMDGLHSMGSGYVLIHREVFLAIRASNQGNRYPWFKDFWAEHHNDWTSEDITFYRQVRNLGINIALHTGAGSEHLKNMKITEDAFLQYNRQSHNHGHVHGENRHGNKIISWWAKSKKSAK